jgi:hypothetical protein
MLTAAVVAALAFTSVAQAYYPEPDTLATAQKVYGCEDVKPKECIDNMIDNRAFDQAFDEMKLIFCPGSYIKNRKLYESRHARYKNHPEFKKIYMYTLASDMSSACVLAAYSEEDPNESWENWLVVPKK